MFIQSLGLASAHVEEFAVCCSEEGRGVLAYVEDTVKAAIEGSFLYRFDKLKRGQYYEKGSLPCLRASIFDRDTELLSSPRYNSDKW